MHFGNLEDEKRLLRMQYREVRSSLPASYCARSDQAIARYVEYWEIYRRAKTVFLFVSMKEEIDTAHIMRTAWRDGKTVAVPRCTGKGIMGAFLIERENQLKPGYCGILEPERGCIEMDGEQIDLALIPCLACTRQGERLGYGGGYYDRYLPGVHGAKAVLCRERLLADHLPAGPGDVRGDWVITEGGILAV